MVFDRRKPKLWRPEEDKVLMELVKVLGKKKWLKVAKGIEEKLKIKRTSTQCRYRWNTILSQSNNHPFSNKEIDIILRGHLKFGNKWSKIAKLLKGRSENQVKNFMHATIRRNMRKFNKGKNDSEKIKLVSLDILSDPEIREILTAKKEVKRSTLMSLSLSKEAKKIIQSYNNLEDNSHNIIQFNITEFEDWNIKDFEDITTPIQYQESHNIINTDLENEIVIEEYEDSIENNN
ncbi:hypothetical protein SteCoe_24871 [Stentor coeruleus]|uniref:Uncharacterized protein n=1 Tax=Stentor coeruleus TaxID=5963 RepID=A0A1R2BGJ6_9CILI|nr:hypothetical protein SteCoe_24871 [Stentor coeruleus]